MSAEQYPPPQVITPEQQAYYASQASAPGAYPPGAYPPGAYPPTAPGPGAAPGGTTYVVAPAPTAAPNVVYVQQPPVTYVVAPAPPAAPNGSTVRYRDIPVKIQCQHCNEVGTTKLHYNTGLFTWVVAGVICLFAPLGCCFIPFCLEDCKDVEHHCHSCHKHVGTYQRMS
ncbi:lipopolysaccharide-induced tumor necrosis factor-alpha factor [Pelomyxa schiedti]|nr:lipopolysaccharide-induced tumor necrosis factor-alpha factor [Pelomyxa schiedti]